MPCAAMPAKHAFSVAPHNRAFRIIGQSGHCDVAESETVFSKERVIRIWISPRYHLCMRTLYLLISLLVPLASQAAINDVLPGDYFPLPPGQTTLAVYAFDRKLSGPYVDGHKLLDGEIDSQVLALRAAHFFQVGSTTLAGVAVIPWSNSLVTPAPFGELLPGSGQLQLQFAR